MVTEIEKLIAKSIIRSGLSVDLSLADIDIMVLTELPYITDEEHTSLWEEVGASLQAEAAELKRFKAQEILDQAVENGDLVRFVGADGRAYVIERDKASPEQLAAKAAEGVDHAARQSRGGREWRSAINAMVHSFSIMLFTSAGRAVGGAACISAKLRHLALLCSVSNSRNSIYADFIIVVNEGACDRVNGRGHACRQPGRRRMLTTDGDNVVSLRPGKPSPEGWSQQEQDALELARLGAMGAIEYERARRGAARKLGIRLSTLNGIVTRIQSAAKRAQLFPPPEDPRPIGQPITFVYDDGRRVTGFLAAAHGRYEKGRDWHLLVLADGHGTAVWSHPLDDDDPRLTRRSAEEPAQL
jgi:hypothetical protein